MTEMPVGRLQGRGVAQVPPYQRPAGPRRIETTSDPTTLARPSTTPTFDADNHYYEATDAYHPAHRPGHGQAGHAVGRDQRPATPAGRGQGQPVHPQPDVRPGGQAGQPRRVLPGPEPRGQGHPGPLRRPRAHPCPSTATATPGWPSWTRQGLDGCFLFPTLGVGMEEALADDPPALVAAFRAFNRWLEDDWGYAYQERIFAAPMITLVDVDAAVARAAARAGRRRPDHLHQGWARAHPPPV